MREWLPRSLSGSTEPASQPRGLSDISVVSSVRNAIAPARENAANAAAMAGLPTSQAHDSAFAACCPKLTFRERVYGCLGCFGLGFIISFLGFISFWTGNMAAFATMYTIGNIVSIIGSGFLLGPKRQWRNMSRAKRRWAVLVYLSLMIVTLAVAFTHGPPPVILVCIFAQWCALIWYIASYIPFGQKMITKVLSKTTQF